MLREPFNGQRLSTLTAVLTSPDGRRRRGFLAVPWGGIRGPHSVRFLRALSRQRRKPVLSLGDRLPVPRRRCVQQALHTHASWLHTEWLPAYAPELHPMEPFGDQLGNTALANTHADNLYRLCQSVRRGLRRVRRRPSIGRGFLCYTGLF